MRDMTKNAVKVMTFLAEAAAWAFWIWLAVVVCYALIYLGGAMAYSWLGIQSVYVLCGFGFALAAFFYAFPVWFYSTDNLCVTTCTRAFDAVSDRVDRLIT